MVIRGGGRCMGKREGNCMGMLIRGVGGMHGNKGK
jgi:hypothetical protein